jgi:flagellar hook-associated protein 3 FlgL
MRVSHRNIYSNMLNYLNRSVTGLVELNLKASSQKQINRPSDDPVGMSRVMSYRDSLKSMDQYRKNVDTAQGWNRQADENLMQVSVVINRLKELAEQASSGTYTAENREQISIEARQMYEQLVSLSNATYEGKYIYAGQKIDKPAFQQDLFAQSNDGSIRSEDIVEISGGSRSTILVQFLDDGSVGEDELNYRFSSNGGKTWSNGTLPQSADPANPDPEVMNLDGVQVTLAAEREVKATDVDDTNDTDGTWLWVRPSAVYEGDDEDDIETDYYGSVGGLSAEADGVFRKDVMVRIDELSGGDIEFSYSTDGGRNWTGGNTAAEGPPATLPVPGGFLELTGASPAAGDQFVIRPNRALMHVEISQNETIQINNIGKEVFGGLYPDGGSSLQPVPLGREGSGSNLFETVGKLVGYLETNTQDGAQEALDDLNDAHKHITTYLAGVGGRENRLDITDSVLSGLELNAKERKSKLEDVDVAELMTELHMQQIGYEAVLKSSTTIMRMSLVNHI